MNYAYVTLLSSINYLPAVLALNANLKQVKSKYPLVVGVTNNIDSLVLPFLDKENISYEVIPFLDYCNEIKQDAQMQNAPQWLNICSKFALFKMFNYDKLVYLDADIMLFTNIDELFEYPDGALYNDNGNPFAGLMVFSPIYHYADFYKAISDKFGIIESEVLEKLFFPFRTNPDYRIPFEYYVNITLPDLDSYNISSFKVIHFIYNYKPWLYETWQDYISAYLEEFPYEISNNREQIIKQYFDNYITPLRIKYPQLKPRF